jgi:phage N-6-adenine-methyltransferase
MPHRTKSKRQNWRTPPDIFHGIRYFLQCGKFQLDAAADAENALAPRHYDGATPETDALKQPWAKWTWCNPPFDQTAAFIEKAIEEASCGNTTVMLLTASTENAYWQPALRSPYLAALVFITGRLAFIDPLTREPVKGNPAGSAIMVFRPTTTAVPVRRMYKWVHRDQLKEWGKSLLSAEK